MTEKLDPKSADDILKKYDKESDTMMYKGVMAKIVSAIAITFSVFQLYTATFGVLDAQLQRAVHLGFGLALVYLLYPTRKSWSRYKVHPFDVLLAVLGAATPAYIVMEYQHLVLRSGTVSGIDLVVGLLGILLVIEATRRIVGLPMVCVVLAFLIYAFAGPYMPGVLAHRGLTIEQLVGHLYFTTEGIFGIPLGVSSTFIFLFILFGAYLESTGLGKFFIDLANAIAGWASGGPAKVAVLSSGLMGTVSGSSVANVVGTGSLTIPMMKKTGYPPEFAGAVEAASSTGGQIMPPIMGAAAFLMAEMVGVPYADIIVRAILPAFLYFLGIFLGVHFKAKKLGLKGLPREELPKWKILLPQIYLILPLVVLVYMIMIGFTMATAAVYATLYCVVVAMISREEGKKKLVMAIPLIPLLFMTLMSRSFEPGTFMGENGSTLCLAIAFALLVINYAISKPNVKSLPTIIDAFENGGKNCLSVGIACGMAGIIAGVVTMTGLGQVLIGAIVGLSNGHLIIALVLTMLCCIVLGMGVPTTANYIIMATTCAPILASGMGLNLMAAHMFCFYFGIVADITPPVALAAYAGSAIAKAPPMKTAWNATRLAIAAFIIPYIFAYNNALIFVGSDVKFLSVASIVISATLGMASIASGLMGYLIRDMKAISRVALVIGGLLMVIPGTVTDLAGLAVLVVVLVLQRIENKKDKAAASV